MENFRLSTNVIMLAKSLSRFSNRVFCRSFSTAPLSACIVGSGPSGFYTAKYLLKKVKNIQISIIDELPTPFGLVRYGVAPDHADTKNVINDFTDNVLSDDRISYFGNVKVSKDIFLSDLHSIFDAVILAYGASSDRKLGIDGEDLSGIYSSRQFVNWYNGHPHFVNAMNENDFLQNESDNVIIIGQGNVAIDCARIFCSNIDKLAVTDITAHSLSMLRKFEHLVKNVFIIGRRGAVQSSFTNKELREVISDMKSDCLAVCSKDEMVKSKESEASMQEMNERAIKRKMSIFDRMQFDDDENCEDDKLKKIHFRFLLSPIKFIGNEHGRVRSVLFEKNELFGNAKEQKAKGMNEFIEIESGLVLTSIGYKSESIGEIESFWDCEKNILSNVKGKVNENGLYCTGWLKRGPSGIIGTNIPDAQETVASVIGDYEKGTFEMNNVDSGQAIDNFVKLLNDKGVHFVDKHGWQNIDEYEKSVGERYGKVREKMISVEEMIKVANGFEL